MNKKELRKELLSRRRNMDKAYKQSCDNLIYHKLIGCAEIIAADTVLTYISTEIEVDTVKFIETMLKKGKTVAVPRCEGKNMRFIRINGFDSLKKGAFGILEPVGNDEVTDFKSSVCITPALSFNRDGYRLGYGGGYYDRFSADYSGIMIGICYEDFVDEIPVEEFDRPVSILITDKEMRCDLGR
ncbi:MAG: 5-formyltetrahydrofolate cyclo-ligase [Ruminiclostridium sp.]|nr:5-formyltetrahydrofolate cyclo-ligase [Ruminiclostridium sp.]